MLVKYRFIIVALATSGLMAVAFAACQPDSRQAVIKSEPSPVGQSSGAGGAASCADGGCRDDAASMPDALSQKEICRRPDGGESARILSGRFPTPDCENRSCGEICDPCLGFDKACQAVTEKSYRCSWDSFCVNTLD